MANEYRRHIARRVVVQFAAHGTENEAPAIEGILLRAAHDTLTIGDAALILGSGRVNEMEGEAVIPLARVIWVQVV